MLLSYKYGNWYIQNMIASDEDVDAYLQKCSEDQVFVKIATEGAARGVFKMRRSGGSWYIHDKAMSAKTLREDYGKRNFFLEGQIKQEPILSSYNPDTVNTIRVLTLNNGKQINIVSAAVRFGRKGAFVDNMHAGGLAVSIDIDKGVMEDYGGRRYDYVKYTEHPDSHIKFKDVAIPQWKDIVNLVYRALSVLPQYRSVGFDIVTTDNGPLILEINTGAGMDLAQVGKKYGIAQSFEEYSLHK